MTNQNTQSTTPETAAAEAAAVEDQKINPPSPFMETWNYFRKNRGAYVGLIIICFILFMAAFAQWVAPFDPIAQDRTAFLKPPIWMEGADPRYILGTDAVGRDILSRLIHGAQLSVTIGVFVVIISMVAGIVLGLVAGYFRGWIEVGIMRMMDTMLALPSLIMAMAIVAILGPGLENAMLAIAIVQLPHYVRLSRASVVSELNKEYVIASQIAGAGHMRQMFVNILPNCMAPLIVQGTLGISSAILDAAALGFLGLGAQPPLPEWGTMLAEAREFVGSAWWVITFPGLCILVTVLAFNLMGDGLRDALDPKMKR